MDTGSHSIRGQAAVAWGRLLNSLSLNEVRSDTLYSLSLYCSFATKVSQLKNLWFFQEIFLKVLKCYVFLWMQRRHNCHPAATFANCVMTLHLLKVHPQTFLSIPITQKCQILSCDNLVANERYVAIVWTEGATCFLITVLLQRPTNVTELSRT